MASDTEISILDIQRALLAAGYDIGPTGADGISGPRTQAALRKFQVDRGLPTSRAEWAKTVAALRGNTAATGAAPGGSGLQTYYDKYPAFAWAFSDPEVRTKLQEGIENKWGPDELAGAIYQTTWWKSKTDGERAWLRELAINPKEAERKLNNYDSITKYIGFSTDYGIPISFEGAARQVDRVVRGEIAPDALEQELRLMAKSLYPQLAQQIDAGATIADLYTPYKQMASQLLGINPSDINLTDTKWQVPLQIVDPNGTRRLATTDEWQKILRTDSRFGYVTSKAGDQDGFFLGNAIGKAFGNVA